MNPATLFTRALATAHVVAENSGYLDSSYDDDGTTVREIIRQGQTALAEMMIYVLIKAGEGDTEDIFIAMSRDGLVMAIEEHFASLTEDIRASYDDEKAALSRMLQEHTDWSPGRHALKCIEPQWQEWTLCIANADHVAL